MDPNVSEWLNLIFRWIHVLAGVMWIGHHWFRWGAAYTWVSGLFLIGIVYMAGNAMGSDRMSSHLSGTIGIVIAIVAFFVYDVLWKQIKDEKVGAAVSFVLFAAVMFAESRFMGGRALYLFA